MDTLSINPVLNDPFNAWESRLINNNNTSIVDNSNQLEH